MNVRNQLLLILPFYGELPSYFGCFLKSVEGRCFDVLFVSNLELPWMPDNVKVVRMSFDDLREMITRKLGVSVKLDSPRRLCDFKPMYGRIFGEYLSGYDYWAHGDCDLVFGRMMDSTLANLLGKGYDVISLRKCWMSGPFGVYRNAPLTNNLYTRADNWLEVVQMPGNRNDILFDECGGHFHQQLARGEMSVADCRMVRDSMLAVLTRSPDVNWFHDDIIVEDSLSDGSFVSMSTDAVLCREGVEIPIFHFIGIKFWRKFYDNCPRLSRDRIGSYAIDDAGFYFGAFSIAIRRVVRLFRILKAATVSVRNGGMKRIRLFLREGR